MARAVDYRRPGYNSYLVLRNRRRAWSELENHLFLDLVIVVVAASLGGMAARLARAPVVLGYLAVGMVIGPHVLEVIENVETVRTLAEIGVILLVFTIGIEIAFRDIYQLGKVVLIGGILQIGITTGAMIPIGLLLGFDFQTSLLLGMIVSLSSTMVVLKTLSDRGELHSLHGRLLVGFLLVQDLAFVPMIALLPVFGRSGSSVLEEAGFGLLKAVLLLVAVVVLGTKAVPWAMARITRLGSREVFILMVVATAFSIAALTEYVGLSAALGAFVAGLLLSESDFGHRALTEVTPLRDVFAALFFASLGMLTDPGFVSAEWVSVVAVIGAVLVFKFVVTAVIVRGFGYLPNTAMLSGVGLGQIGEFSFILAAGALSLGVVDQDFHSLVVVSAVLTMVIAPALIAGSSIAVTALSRRLRVLRPYRIGNDHAEERPPHLYGHVIICGLGRVGTLVATALRDYDVPFIAVDLDPYTLEHWQNEGYYTVQGSSGSVEVLTAARIHQAAILVITTGDPVSVWVTAQHARQLQPDLDIVARVHWREEGERLQELGVQEVVWPQMEAGLEILRHSLYRYRTPRDEVDDFVDNLRSHLSFSVHTEVEDLLPPEGTGAPHDGTAHDVEELHEAGHVVNDPEEVPEPGRAGD